MFFSRCWSSYRDYVSRDASCFALSGKTFLLLFSLLLSFAIAGCPSSNTTQSGQSRDARVSTQPSQTDESRAAVTASNSENLIEMGYDGTLSDRAHLPTYALLGAQLCASLNDSDRVVMYRVDWDTTSFLDRNNATSYDAVLQAVTREMKEPPKQDRARPRQFWDLATARATADSNVFIILFGDASDEDPDPAAWRAYVEAGKSLGANPRVKKVIFCGCERGNRARLEKAFAPLGPDRLLILGPTEADFATLNAALNTARN